MVAERKMARSRDVRLLNRQTDSFLFCAPEADTKTLGVASCNPSLWGETRDYYRTVHHHLSLVLPNALLGKRKIQLVVG